MTEAKVYDLGDPQTWSHDNVAFFRLTSLPWNEDGRQVQRRSLAALFPELTDLRFCPVRACPESDLSDPDDVFRWSLSPNNTWDIIVHLMDTHEWSRDQVADWVKK